MKGGKSVQKICFHGQCKKMFVTDNRNPICCFKSTAHYKTTFYLQGNGSISCYYVLVLYLPLNTTSAF